MLYRSQFLENKCQALSQIYCYTKCQFIQNIINLAMSKFGLQSFGNFTNSTVLDNNSIVQCQQRLFLSPSGNFLGQLDELCNHRIFNTSSYEQIEQKITFKFVSAAFHANDRQLFYVTPLSLVKYDLNSMQESVLVSAPINSSSMNLLSFAPDYQSLFYLNFSDVYSGYLPEATFSPQIAIKSTNKCSISYYKLHPSLPSIVTSSPSCFLCKWDMINGTLQLTKELDLLQVSPGCFTNQLVFKDSDLFLTKKYNVQNKVQIFQIDFQSFTLNQSTIRNMRFINQWSYLVLAQNYLLTYLGGISSAWINKDSLSNASQVNSFNFLQYVKHAIYNPFKLELYQFMQRITMNGTFNYIDRSQLSFNCALISNFSSGDNKNTPLSTTCSCPQNQVFNRSSLQCQTLNCDTQNGVCVCPSSFRFNAFTQECLLDCSTEQHSLLTLPNGNPSQCYCEYPYGWYDMNVGCILNCSKIQNTFNQGLSENCQCQQGFQWISAEQKCVRSSNPQFFIDPIPQPDFIPTPVPQFYPLPEPIPTPIAPPVPRDLTEPLPSPTGLTIFFIIISVLLIIIYGIFYIRKIRNRRYPQAKAEKNSQKNQVLDMQVVDTDRPLPKFQNGNHPTIKSSEHLVSLQKKQTEQGQPKQQPAQAQQNLQNFSIDDQEYQPDLNKQDEKQFSQLQSHIQQPLK